MVGVDNAEPGKVLLQNVLVSFLSLADRAASFPCTLFLSSYEADHIVSPTQKVFLRGSQLQTQIPGFADRSPPPPPRDARTDPPAQDAAPRFWRGESVNGHVTRDIRADGRIYSRAGTGMRACREGGAVMSILVRISPQRRRY
ncbi:hypothetical protein EDB86DRAFT_1128963 [Lactarius hatsudake]|nr:hypothetical protein EDB86DRAFT_1128963 [Lactarius hatsudake]